MMDELITFFSENMSTVVSATAPFVSSVLTAVFLRRNTKAQEVEKLKTGQFNEAINELLHNQKMTYLELYKTKNFLKIAHKADKYYSEKYANAHKKEEDTTKQNQYDFDWFINFYEFCGNVSNDQMQKLWSKILAGEINKPNTYPLRLIDDLRKMSSYDLKLIEKVSEYIIYRKSEPSYIPNLFYYLSTSLISQKDLLKLRELNIVFDSSDYNTRESIQNSPECSWAITNENILIGYSIKHLKSKIFSFKDIFIPVYRLTEIGEKIFELIHAKTSDKAILCYGISLNEQIGIHAYEKPRKDYEISVYKIKGLYEAENNYLCDYTVDLLDEFDAIHAYYSVYNERNADRQSSITVMRPRF